MENTQNRSKTAALAAVGILSALLAAFLVYNHLGDRRIEGAAGSGILLQLDDTAVPYAGGPPVDRSGGSGIKIPGYASITIPSGRTDVSVSLLNPEDNPCYFTFELVLADTEESLYTSGMVEPSMCIETIRLAKPLEIGEYPLTLKIRTYDLENHTAMNNANVQTVLRVV